jgi:hypothetical protein
MGAAFAIVEMYQNNRIMLSVFNKNYNGRAIRIREDKYVCLTDMATASGKLLGGWSRLKSTDEYLEALSEAMQICIGSLLEVENGTTTWGHPKVAIRFAQWCSVKFAVQVDFWIDELMTTGSVSIAPAPIPQLPSRVLAVETAVAIDRIQDVLSKSNPRLAQILIDCAMNDVLDLTRSLPPSNEFPEDKWYGLVQIASKMGIATNVSTRVKLGQYIGKRVKELNLERVQEERLCNGQYESIWCYRDNDVVRSAINDWHQQLVN